MRKDAISGLFQGRTGRRRAAEETRRLSLESLEGRRLLAVTGNEPAITGTVFVDRDENGSISPGEALENAVVELYLDDGDGISDGGDTLVGTDNTDANGLYCFDNLDGNATYFVVQPAQTIDGIPLLPMTSDAIEPGEASLIVDQFETNQSVVATAPPVPTSNGSTLTFGDETEVIGAERDMFVTLNTGIGEVELTVNPFNLLPVLQYSSTSGVEGGSILTWDGIDNDPNPVPSLGLNGRDLTESGANTGFTMRLGIDPSGAGDTLTILLYQGDVSNVSSASVPIPVTDGTASAYLFMPFSTFSGPVSASNVDAIQMRLGEGVPSADAQIEFLGVTGPQTQDFANNLPPTDLAITKTDGALTSVPGGDIEYTITVENLGPSDVIGAVVDDVFPPELLNVVYTSVATGSASGNTNGTGNINDLVNMPVGSTIVYTVDADISSAATGTLSNTATVTAPSTVMDTNLNNNTSTDVNTLNREVDLIIAKTDNRDTISPGDLTTYLFTVTNAGPSDVSQANVTDIFPAELNAVSFTSTPITGTVSGNTSGNGDINDLVDMTAGSSLLYTVSATLDNSATQPLVNTATVDAPVNTTELDPSNNTDTDTNTLVLTADLAITKDAGSTTVEPGQVLNYTIVVTNNGPNNVAGATVTDSFPAELEGVTFTSNATGGASGNTSGSGDINDLVNLPVDSTITYNASGTVSTLSTNDIVNSATVTEPVGVIDPNLSNNTDADVTVLVPGVDLEITKTNNQNSVFPGEEISYEIVVTNNGPNPVTGATVQDLFPSELTDVSFTSEATGGASGNTDGNGDINDVLDLGVNGSVTYTVEAVVDANADGTLSNTATVTEPNNVVELDPSNNTSTDIDPIQQRLSSISGSVYLDLDFDGLAGVGEPGIAGVEVVLEDADRREVDRAVTDENGVYEFVPLAAGPYFVREVQPLDFRDGLESVTGDIGVVVASDLFFANLADNDDATGLNFGDLPLQPSKRELLASRFRDFV